jgi:undecaprenyl-diphosphatase
MSSMQYISAAVLGVVEGLTEFLPVSSTGHLILSDEILGFQGPPGKVFEIVVQLGAILAVCWIYRARLFEALVGVTDEPRAQRFVANVLFAFVPAAIIGAFAHNFIKEVLFSPWVVAVSLIVGGIAILIIERIRPPPRVLEVDELRIRHALKIGICQCLAMVPGISRSGATIMGALMLGVDRKAATEFSFFLAIPTMFAATIYDLFKNRASLSGHDASVIAIGLVTAFISALIVVRWFVGFISRHGFAPFAWYRIVLGAAALVLLISLR